MTSPSRHLLPEVVPTIYVTVARSGLSGKAVRADSSTYPNLSRRSNASGSRTPATPHPFVSARTDRRLQART